MRLDGTFKQGSTTRSYLEPSLVKTAMFLRDKMGDSPCFAAMPGVVGRYGQESTRESEETYFLQGSDIKVDIRPVREFGGLIVSGTHRHRYGQCVDVIEILRGGKHVTENVFLMPAANLRA